MRHFLARLLQDLFADHFGRQVSLRLIRDVVFGKVSRAFGEPLENRFAHALQSIAGKCGDRNQLREISRALIFHQPWHQLAFIFQIVDLVQQQNHRRAHIPDHVERMPVIIRKR